MVGNCLQFVKDDLGRGLLIGNKMSAPPNNNQRFFVTIPKGVRPGQSFALILNGQQMVVRCPEGNKPGDRLIVTSPRTQVQQYVVTVPPNVKAGDQFRVMIQNQEIMVRLLYLLRDTIPYNLPL